MPGRRSQNLIRTFVGLALCASLTACLAAPVPEDIPAVALQQPTLYRLEIALLVFYGGLLLITPAFSGLVHGRLPIEISTRGARFAEDDKRAAELDEAAVKRLRATIADLADALADTQIETEQLSGIVASDNKQRGVHSNRD